MNNDIFEISDVLKKYHLGCGEIILKGFVNVDLKDNLQEDTIYTLSTSNDQIYLNRDLRKGIPAKTDSLELVYHGHMLEHLTYVDGIAFIKECFRVLQPEGLLRVLVPDLELWISNYSINNAFF
jgi:predicted SAM-dependent methyltransferase